MFSNLTIESMLESRCNSIAESFRKLSSYNIQKEIFKHLRSKRLSKLDANTIDKIITEGFKRQTLIPVFFEDKQTKSIKAYQEEIFDIFVLAEAFASYMRGVDQYPAAVLLTRERYYQFAVFAYYTSAFHLVDSILTLHGICLIAQPICGIKKSVIKTEKKHGGGTRDILKLSPVRFAHQSILCKYDYQSSKWSFVPCKFKHEDRWKWFCELIECYLDGKKRIPKGITNLFGYIKVAEEYREYMWMNEKEYSLKFSDDEEFKKILSKSWKILPKLRHDAIYQNIKYDVIERVYVRKGLNPPKQLTEVRMKIFQEFTKALIEWASKLIYYIVNETKRMLGDDKVFYRALNEISKSPLIEMVDVDPQRISASREIEEASKLAKEIIALIIS